MECMKQAIKKLGMTAGKKGSRSSSALTEMKLTLRCKGHGNGKFNRALKLGSGMVNR